jgi:RNA polymerase sigma factor (sigma-70 family)
VRQVLSTSVPSNAAICEQYAPLVEGMVRHLHVPGNLCDDARQEGYIGLLEAIRRYDSTLPVHFAVFARPYVKGAIVRHIYTKTQVTETAADDPHARRTSAGQTYEIESDTVEALQIEAWLATLPRSDAWLLRRTYWDDATSDQIAADLGVTRRRVNQIHTKLLRQGAIALAERGDGPDGHRPQHRRSHRHPGDEQRLREECSHVRSQSLHQERV